MANMKQRNLTNSQYLENFTNHIETMETCQATIGYSQAMVMTELPNITPPYMSANAPPAAYMTAIERAKDKYLAAAFLAGADITRFGSMLKNLENDYLCGDRSCYPLDINEAYNRLSNWKNDPKNITRTLEDTSQDGVSFF